MPRARHHATAARSARPPWHPRACVRWAVTLRVDYATPQGWVGLVRNLSLQGMYIESVGRSGTPVVGPGDLLTMVVVLPAGRPCKLHAVVIHGDRHGWGVQFRAGHPPALAPLAHYWSSLEAGGR